MTDKIIFEEYEKVLATRKIAREVISDAGYDSEDELETKHVPKKMCIRDTVIDDFIHAPPVYGGYKGPFPPAPDPALLARKELVFITREVALTASDESLDLYQPHPVRKWWLNRVPPAYVVLQKERLEGKSWSACRDDGYDPDTIKMASPQWDFKSNWYKLNAVKKQAEIKEWNFRLSNDLDVYHAGRITVRIESPDLSRRYASIPISKLACLYSSPNIPFSSCFSIHETFLPNQPCRMIIDIDDWKEDITEEAMIGFIQDALPTWFNTYIFGDNKDIRMDAKELAIMVSIPVVPKKKSIVVVAVRYYAPSNRMLSPFINDFILYLKKLNLPISLCLANAIDVSIYEKSKNSLRMYGFPRGIVNRTDTKIYHQFAGCRVLSHLSAWQHPPVHTPRLLIATAIDHVDNMVNITDSKFIKLDVINKAAIRAVDVDVVMPIHIQNLIHERLEDPRGANLKLSKPKIYNFSLFWNIGNRWCIFKKGVHGGNCMSVTLVFTPSTLDSHLILRCHSKKRECCRDGQQRLEVELSEDELKNLFPDYGKSALFTPDRFNDPRFNVVQYGDEDGMCRKYEWSDPLNKILIQQSKVGTKKTTKFAEMLTEEFARVTYPTDSLRLQYEKWMYYIPMPILMIYPNISITFNVRAQINRKLQEKLWQVLPKEPYGEYNPDEFKHEIFKKFKFAHYFEMKAGMVPLSRLITCYNSIHKCDGMTYDIVVMDEIETTMAMVTSQLLWRMLEANPEERKMVRAFNSLRDQLGACNKIIAMDADIGDRSLMVLKTFIPDGTKVDILINNARPEHMKRKWAIVYSPEDLSLYSSKMRGEPERSAADSWFELLVHSIRDGKKVVVCCTSKSFASKFHKWLLEHSQIDEKMAHLDEKSVLLYVGGDEQKKRELKDIDTIWPGAQVVIYTPVITVGVSFNEVHFDELFFYASIDSAPMRIVYQMATRVRNLKNNNIQLLIVGRSKNYPTTIEEIQEQLNVRYKWLQALQARYHPEYVAEGKIRYEYERTLLTDLFVLSQLELNTARLQLPYEACSWLLRIGEECTISKKKEEKKVVARVERLGDDYRETIYSDHESYPPLEGEAYGKLVEDSKTKECTKEVLEYYYKCRFFNIFETKHWDVIKTIDPAKLRIICQPQYSIYRKLITAQAAQTRDKDELYKWAVEEKKRIRAYQPLDELKLDLSHQVLLVFKVLGLVGIDRLQPGLQLQWPEDMKGLRVELKQMALLLGSTKVAAKVSEAQEYNSCLKIINSIVGRIVPMKFTAKGKKGHRESIIREKVLSFDKFGRRGPSVGALLDFIKYDNSVLDIPDTELVPGQDYSVVAGERGRYVLE